MRSQKEFFYSLLLIFFIASILYLKNYYLAVNIKAGIRTMGIDYAGFAFFLLSLLSLFNSVKIPFYLFSLINIFNSLMLLSNRIYYRYFGDYITLDIFRLTPHIPFTWKNILNLIKLKDLLTLVDIPFLLLLFIISLKKIKFNLKRNVLFAISFFLMGISLTGLNLFLLHKTLPGVLSFRYGSSLLFNSMSVHNFYLLNFYEERIRKIKMNFPEPVLTSELISNNFEIDRRFNIEKKLWNIIMVEFETLGAELINKKVDGQEITPVLNKISREGIYFSNFYSQALTCSGTLDVELSALSTFYPSPDSPNAIKYAKKIPFALPRFLREKGYKTMFFHANSGSFYRRSTVMRIFGFEELYFADYFHSRERKFKGTDDLPFFLESAQVIKNSPQPFFAYLVTLSSHTPFVLPKGEKPGLEIKDSVDEETANYYQIFNYVDRSFKAFLDELSTDSIRGKTIFFIFGDHGRKVPGDEKDERRIIDETIKNKVPLIILIPGLEGMVIDEPASHGDIPPTILSILGLKYDGVLLGRNLLSERNQGFVLINRKPVILITKRNVFWGHIDKGFISSLHPCSEEEISESNKFLNILRYSEFTLKKK